MSAVPLDLVLGGVSPERGNEDTAQNTVNNTALLSNDIFLPNQEALGEALREAQIEAENGSKIVKRISLSVTQRQLDYADTLGASTVNENFRLALDTLIFLNQKVSAV